MIQKHLLRPLALVGLASAATAQISINELYVSHSGTDDREYVELFGTPGTSLTDLMLLVVEGDATSSGFGFLDRAIDLSSGGTLPSDGFFVVGNTIVPDLDLDAGSDNVFENGTETFYLIEATSVGAITSLIGTDVRAGTDTTILSTLGTILDSVGLADGGITATDIIFDGATQIGPDGTFLPAGGFRGGDAPNPWCTSLILDFDVDLNNLMTRTPGYGNVACANGIQERMWSDINDISIASGGVQTFTLESDGGALFDLFWVVSATSGNTPGILSDGVLVPTNFDNFFLFTLLNPGLVISNSLSFFDVTTGTGVGTSASVALALPPLDSSLLGVTLDTAFLRISGVDFSLLAASNSVPTRFVP